MSLFLIGGTNVMLCYWWHKCHILTIGGTNVAVGEMSVGQMSVGQKSRHRKTCHSGYNKIVKHVSFKISLLCQLIFSYNAYKMVLQNKMCL
jgi:hypothetical protein